jgi:hypothetical protein
VCSFVSRHGGSTLEEYPRYALSLVIVVVMMCRTSETVVSRGSLLVVQGHISILGWPALAGTPKAVGHVTMACYSNLMSFIFIQIL